MSENKSVPTMKDVAREAGVALGTVSKVVNGIPVGEEYRLRVEAAIEKLSYRVSSYARGLRSNRTYTVAVMVPNLISPFFSKLVDCINRELSARKYRKPLASSQPCAVQLCSAAMCRLMVGIRFIPMEKWNSAAPPLLIRRMRMFRGSFSMSSAFMS